MGKTQALATMLGLKGEIRSGLELLPHVRKGLPYRSIENVARELELTVDETADSLGLARRTMARRKTLRTLDPSESERVVRLGSALAFAADVIGSRTKARAWLTAPNRALGGVPPLSLLDTDIGARAVEDVLVRIEHGVFS